MITDYASLQTEIANWLKKSNPSTLAAIPTFIQLAETDIRKRIIAGGASERATATTTGEYLALPEDFGGVREIKIELNPVRQLRYETPQRLTELYRSDVSGIPAVYTIQDQQFRFRPSRAGDTVEITYYKDVPALSDTATTNWLLTDSPNCYLYGSLTHAEPYLRNDARIATWGTLYSEAMRALGSRDAFDRWSGGPLTGRPRAVA